MFQTIQATLTELSEVLQRAGQERYTFPYPALNGATIGQHIRHTIELFDCVLNHYDDGHFSYDDRRRDLVLSSDLNAALQALERIGEQVQVPDKIMRSSYAFNERLVEIDTTYYRELMYNLEHCIHHNAIVRIVLEADGLTALPEHFGVAPSTVQHKAACAH
jgi:hypothetical protein